MIDPSTMVDSILAAGLQGIQRGLAGAAEKAEQISKGFSPESDNDPTSAIIGLKLDEHQVQASAKIVQVADRLSQSVLDILA
ncbi:MAG: hypothetical protein J5J00_00270 [Deltaproteobacteria bacterium]|nr:hypothetical protein [Deltaproteobacteria bacterium]